MAAPTVQSQFEIPPGTSSESILSRLQESFTVESSRPERVTHSYVDTFDWRLHDDGVAVELIAARRGTSLRWRRLGEPTPRLERPVEQAPRFAWDLPEGELRRRLGGCIEMRALLPYAETVARRTAARIVDDEDKTVLRLELWSPRARSEAGRLLLLPVRGYDKPLAKVARFARKTLRLAALESDPAAVLARASERPPATVLPLVLDPAARSDSTCKLILGRLADVVADNESGVIDDLDSEFLHDYRVAMRRARSLLTQVKGVFPPARVERLRSGLGWLSDLTSAPRDMDVYLLGFEGYRAAVPERLRDALDPLRAAIEQRKRDVHRQLVRALRSQRYRRLIDGWRRFAAEPGPARPVAPNALAPIRRVARERIWRAYRKALAQGGAIEPGSPAEALHDLRKTCKKLRYLLEFFRSLFPADAVGRSIKVLKQLQDVLGDFQDFEVQHDQITVLRSEMAREAPLAGDTAEALDLLLAHLGERQATARAEFARRFETFATRENREAFRRLFKPAKGDRR